VSFVAQCVFCNHKVQVPDDALGASGRCPKCANPFTLAPASDLPPVKLPAFVRAAATRPAAPLPAAPPLPEALLPAGRAVSPAARAGAERGEGLPGPAALEIVKGPAGPPPPRRWVDPVGAVSLFLGGVALLSASVPPLCPFVPPVSALALLGALAGLARALVGGRFRLLVPAVAAVVAAGVLVAALRSPDLLGPTYALSRPHETPRPDAIQALPLAGGDTDANADWPDAGKTALVQGGLQVRVVAASVGRVEVLRGGRKKLSAAKYLVVRLRVQQVAGGGEFDPARGSPPPTREAAPRPVLTDDAGKVYPPQDVLDSDAAADVRRSSVFPVAVVEQAFAFEPPPAAAKYLRLEVSAAAWGGSGTFRFTIPRALIQTAPAAPARAAPKKDR
jgi:hypothetical protein